MCVISFSAAVDYFEKNFFIILLYLQGSFGQIRERLRHPFSAALKAPSPIGSDSLTELLDGLIILYHIGVHKNYVKVNIH